MELAASQHRRATLPLAGRHALVVGGGSGIGLGSARLLAMDGATVTIAGRTKEKLEAAAGKLAEERLHVRYQPCDALVADEVRRAVSEASREGALDIAVVVPGATSLTPILMYEDDDFGREVDRNVRPVFLTLKYAGLAMVRAGGGSFVAISSTAAAFSTRFISGYAAGKAAVDQLIAVAADELGEYGVRVNSIRSGMTRTPASEGSFANRPLIEAFIDQQAIKRSGEIEDQAAAVRFLAGPESSWITGQHLAVDGGHTLRAFPDYRLYRPVPDQGAFARGEGVDHG